MNVIVAGKQPALNYLPMEEAVEHCTRGLGIWDWASTDEGGEPDVVLGCAGDVPTLETLAAAAILRERLPDLKVRVVNVVDLMRLQPESEHPHGLPDTEFDSLFTTDRPIVFAYHGYPWLIHRLTYRRTNHRNLHVRGYKEEGTTTTPFDMVMLNDLDRFHLVIDVIDRVPGLARQGGRSAAGHGRGAAALPGLDPRTRRGRSRDRQLDLAVLTVNAGSTSLKLHLVEGEESRPVVGYEKAEAVGHRVVHGGSRFVQPTLIDDDVVSEMDALTPLAPLHNVPALAAIREARAELPDIPHVAAFDTAFHASIPEEASTYAVPRRWREDWGVRRYGFHGIAVEWVASQVPVARLVVCHLGGGCSVTAVLDGRSVDTTMGFSPLEGIPMATRSGSIDPAVLPYLVREHGLSLEDVESELENESGLAALGGLDDPLGFGVYTYRDGRGGRPDGYGARRTGRPCLLGRCRREPG